MTTLETKNGTKFNFKLDNGLPYKPILDTTFKLFNQKNNKDAGIIRIFLENNEQNNLLSNIEFKALEIDEHEVYIDLGDYYLYIEHNSNFFYQSAQNKTLFIELYRNDVCLFGAYVK